MKLTHESISKELMNRLDMNLAKGIGLEYSPAVRKACRKLRSSVKQSQQSMAASLGISMAAIRNYESGKSKPDARALAAYMAMADVVQLPELAVLFGKALEQRLGMTVIRLAVIRESTILATKDL